MKISKICTILLLTILLISLIIPKTYALSEIVNDGKKFMQKGQDNAIDEDALEKTSGNIYNILLGIGIGVAVIIGGVIGVQLIFGSVEAKAKVSEALVPYIVGCFVIFGAFGIWSMLVKSGNDMEGDVSYKSGLATKPSETIPNSGAVVYCSICQKNRSISDEQAQQLSIKGSIKLSCGHVYEGSAQYTK